MNRRQSEILWGPAPRRSTKRLKQCSIGVVATSLDDDFAWEVFALVSWASLRSATKAGTRMVWVHQMQATSQSYALPACSYYAHWQDYDFCKLGSCDSRYNGDAAPRGARVSRLLTKSFCLCQFLAFNYFGKSITSTINNINSIIVTWIRARLLSTRNKTLPC